MKNLSKADALIRQKNEKLVSEDTSMFRAFLCAPQRLRASALRGFDLQINAFSIRLSASAPTKPATGLRKCPHFE